jgi:hypothetical protein
VERNLISRLAKCCTLTHAGYCIIADTLFLMHSVCRESALFCGIVRSRNSRDRGSTDCESVENRGFTGLFGNPVCELCARFRIHSFREPAVVASFRAAGSRTGQTVSLSVVLTTNVGDREIERPGQFPADPVQGIKPRTAAAVLTTHLLDHYFGI